jgi:hypothetical protein
MHSSVVDVEHTLLQDVEKCKWCFGREVKEFARLSSSISTSFCVVAEPKVSSHIDKTQNQLLKFSPKNSLPFNFFEVLNFLDI